MFAKCVIILVPLAILIESAKILVVSPTFAKSHQVPFRSLIQELINRDHEVTAITTEPVYPQGVIPNNLNEINLHNSTYSLWNKVIMGLEKSDDSNVNKMRHSFRCLSDLFIEQLKDKSVQNLLTDSTITFDLLIVETCPITTLIFSNIFKAPVILMSAFGALPGDMKTIGSVTHPLLYPTHYHRRIYNLTLHEKICELYFDIAYTNVHENQELDDNKLLKNHFGIDTPKLGELRNNVHMFFLNIHPILLHNQPVPPGVVYIWGLNKRSEETLPKDLQSYLDSSKNGVIYMSFGSIFKSSQIPSEIIDIFLKVFSRLPYNILWKWDTNELPGKSNNIKISKWFPQPDLLRHPKIKLFITHGGLRSTEEAIDAGVPLIGIPQFSDQEYNTEKYVYFKIGVKLDYSTITVDNLETAIKTILTSYDSYKSNIVRLRTLMNDQPRPVSKQVMGWIDHILRHGGLQHLRAPAANMSWLEYYELELVLLILVSLIVVLTVLLFTVKTCLRGVLCLIKNKTLQRKVSFHKPSNLKK